MAKRLDELSGSQAAFPVELVHFIDVTNRHQVEAELHQKFKAHRKHGEWFEFSRGASEVERAMSQYEKSGSGSSEKWRLLTLITGIIFLLMAWQSTRAIELGII